MPPPARRAPHSAQFAASPRHCAGAGLMIRMVGACREPASTHAKERAMTQATQNTMRAEAIDQFGGPERMALRTLPVPEIAADEVLMRVESAGVGAWDPFEREGGFARMMGTQPTFPYVLGSDGAGTVAAVGERV